MSNKFKLPSKSTLFYMANIALLVYFILYRILLRRAYPDNMPVLHMQHTAHYHGLPHELIHRAYEGITYIIPSDEMMPAIMLAIVLILDAIIGELAFKLLAVKHIDRILCIMLVIQIIAYYFIV